MIADRFRSRKVYSGTEPTSDDGAKTRIHVGCAFGHGFMAPRIESQDAAVYTSPLVALIVVGEAISKIFPETSHRAESWQRAGMLERIKIRDRLDSGWACDLIQWSPRIQYPAFCYFEAMMADTAPLARQWRLLQILSMRRLATTVRELAVEMNVVDKTIRRDLQFLASIGFPLVETVGEYGRKSWRLDFPSGVPPLSFTLTEIAALHVGRELMLPLVGTDFGSGAQSAFRKIRSALGDAAVRYLSKLASVFHATSLGSSDYSNHTAIIDQLMIACEDSKVALITYQSQRSTEPVTLEVYPYGLVYHKGALYLVAFAREHEELRHYKLNRISAVDIHALQIPIQRPATFDLKQHLTDSFGIMCGSGETQRVRIRFTHDVARIVSEKTWHPSQKLTDQHDGSLIAEFVLDDLREVTSWVLSFGAKAEVLEPQSLRREIINDLKGTLDSYGGSNSPHSGRAATTTSSKTQRRAK